jgi:Tfp pilus assembly protein FimT
VVAVVGVLAVVATPKIIGVATDARRASLDGVLSALDAAGARNYAVRTANGVKGSAVISCESTKNVLEGGEFPSGYEIDGDGEYTDGRGGVVNWGTSSVKATCKLQTISTPVIDGTFRAISIL